MTDFTDAVWRKAAASSSDGNCVEVARTGLAVGVRDSKNRAAGHLEFSAAEWQAFTASMRGGAYTRST